MTVRLLQRRGAEQRRAILLAGNRLSRAEKRKNDPLGRTRLSPIVPRTQPERGVVVVIVVLDVDVAVAVADGDHSDHGHDHVYDHDPVRPSRDQGSSLLLDCLPALR